METLANPPVSTCGPARRGGGNLVPSFCARRVVMKIMYASLLLAGVFCISGNGCNAQQASRGPTDLDGLYKPPAETAPSVPKQRGINRHTKTETVAQRPVSDSKLTNWEEEAVRQQADDDRLKRKLNICQKCTAPEDKRKPGGL